MEIEGQIFETQSGKSSIASLIVHDTNIYIKYIGLDKNKTYCCDRSELKIDPPIGNIRRKINLPDGRVFETENLESVDALLPKGFWSGLFKVERNWRLITPLAIITPFMAFGLFRLLIPVFITIGMAMTPDEALHAIDDNAIRFMDRVIMEKSELSPTHKAKIQQQFNLLLSARTKVDYKESGRNFDYKLLFRRADQIGPNAFALPGGTIVITDALVKEFPQDHIIMAVLAHEIGHVENEHSLRQIFRVVGIATTFNLIAGDAGPLIEGIMEEGAAIMSLSYSRAHETESDNFSYELLKASEQPVHGLIDFFENLDVPVQETEEKDWVSTHPLSSNRIKNIKTRMAEDGIPLPR